MSGNLDADYWKWDAKLRLELDDLNEYSSSDWRDIKYFKALEGRFSRLFRECAERFELTDEEIATRWECSLPTIEYWKRGDYAPHMRLWGAFMEWFRELRDRHVARCAWQAAFDYLGMENPEGKFEIFWTQGKETELSACGKRIPSWAKCDCLRCMT